MKPSSKRPLLRTLVFGALCLAAVLGNLFVPGLFWDRSRGTMLDYLQFAATGTLVAEVCLLGIWCGLARQPIKYRLPITLALLIVAICAYVSGLQLPDIGRGRKSSMPLEPALVIGGAAIGGFVLMQLPLWLLQRSTKCCIAFDTGARVEAADQVGATKGNQFGIGYLMLCTAAVAVLLVFVRQAMPGHSGGPGLREFIEVILGILVYIPYSLTLTVPHVWIVLTRRPRLLAIVTLGVGLVVGPFLIWLAVVAIFGPQSNDFLPYLLSYQIGLAASTTLVLLLLRVVGYRTTAKGDDSPEERIANIAA